MFRNKEMFHYTERDEQKCSLIKYLKKLQYGE